MSDVAVTFGAKDENLAKTFKSVGEQTKSLGEQFKTLLIPLAAIGGAFLAIRKMSADFQKAIDMGGRLRELSLQTDESAGNLMVLQRAFQNAGAGAETVGTTLARMNRFIAEAGEGGKAQTEIMGKLGLTMADLADKTPTEQLKLLAERVAGLQSPADRTNVAMQLFGRSGAELIPLFRAMGVELENARNQLGSAPAVADKAAAMFNTLGNNIKAVREKSAEFAFGLLSELLPNLVAVSTRLANIDAAGVGAKLSEYAKKTLDWATETFKLGMALRNIETAFSAITNGNIGDGLKLIFLTMRDTALNAINEIFANAKAAIETAGHLLMTTLRNTLGNPNLMDALAEAIRVRIGASIVGVGATALETIRNTMNALVNSWNFVVNDLSGMLSNTLSKTFQFLASDLGQAISNPIAFAAGKIPLMLAKSSADAAKEVEANFDIASTKVFTSLENAFTNASADYETKISASNKRVEAEGVAAFEAIGNEAKNSGEVFRASYESNIANPLIEMEERARETADQFERVESALQGAAQEVAKINKFGQWQGPPMPAQGRSDELVDGPKPAPTPSGGNATVAAPRQLTNRERAIAAGSESRASQLESQGAFGSADRAREQGERKVEQQRLRDANRELQKDLGIGGSVGKTPEQIAREEGKVSPLNKDAFEKRVQDIKDEIKRRAGQGDGTEDTSGKGGKDGKDEPTQSPLEKLVSEIKSLVEKIEPKLPVAALTA